MKKEKENIVLNKSFEFAEDIIDVYNVLNKNKHYAIANQIVRSGTSIGANIREAQRAVSIKDFINKMSIALKEADETKFWFELINSKIYPIDEALFYKVEELIKLLVSIINSLKERI